MSVTTRVDDRGLPRLVFADRGVVGDDMRHLVRQHRRQFRGVVRQRDQAARDIELAGRQREGVDRRRIQDRDLIGQVRPLGRGDQPLDGLGDQRQELRVVIDAAIGGEDALVLALDDAGLLHRAVGCARQRGRGLLRRGRRRKTRKIAAAGEQQRCRQRARQNRALHRADDLSPQTLRTPSPSSCRRDNTFPGKSTHSPAFRREIARDFSTFYGGAVAWELRFWALKQIRPLSGQSCKRPAGCHKQFLCKF